MRGENRARFVLGDYFFLKHLKRVQMFIFNYAKSLLLECHTKFLLGAYELLQDNRFDVIKVVGGSVSGSLIRFMRNRV